MLRQTLEGTRESINRVVAERDEVMDLLETERGLAARYRDLAERQSKLIVESRASAQAKREGLEAHLIAIGEALEARTSATAVLALCRSIMDTRSPMSALVAGHLTVGFSKAKDRPVPEVRES